MLLLPPSPSPLSSPSPSPLPSSTAPQSSSSTCSRFSSNSTTCHLLPTQGIYIQNGENSKYKLRIAWIRGSELFRSGRRIGRCIVSGVSLSSIHMGNPSSPLNEEVYHGMGLLAQSTLCYGGIWSIGVDRTPPSTNGIFNMAITLSTQKESLEDHDLAMLIGTVETQIPQETIQAPYLPSETDKDSSEADDMGGHHDEGFLEEISEESAEQVRDEELMNLEKRENLRRQRISFANKGKIPWNKGKQHSEETKRRIRETVTMKMRDPKLREKLRLQAEAIKTRPETLLKMKNGIRNAWKEKRRIRAIQETCVMEWMDMIAEAARKGEEGDTIYEWDSYLSIKRHLRSVSKSEKKKKEVVCRGALSAEHRLRISEAIKAKWSDPSYRETVKQGVLNAEKKRTMTSSNSRPKKKYAHHHVNMNKASSRVFDSAPIRKIPPRKPDVPAYKDSEATTKLEKLKSMRASRVSLEEIKRRDITERARVLIAQAEEAAKALEAAAMKDKSALAPLLETRRLLAEAVRSIESTSGGQYRKPLNIRDGNQGQR